MDLTPSSMLRHSVYSTTKSSFLEPTSEFENQERRYSKLPNDHETSTTLNIGNHLSEARASMFSKGSLFDEGSQMHRLHSFASQFGPSEHSEHEHHHHHHHHHGHHHHHHNEPIIEEIPTRPKIMIHQTFNDYNLAMERIQELDEQNERNDQIILLFLASKDKMGRVWHYDCATVDKVVTFLVRKIKAGGHLLKIFVGDRKDWMDKENLWRNDEKFKINNLPTILVCDTMKRINGRKALDMEALCTLLKD